MILSFLGYFGPNLQIFPRKNKKNCHIKKCREIEISNRCIKINAEIIAVLIIFSFLCFLMYKLRDIYHKDVRF